MVWRVSASSVRVFVIVCLRKTELEERRREEVPHAEDGASRSDEERPAGVAKLPRRDLDEGRVALEALDVVEVEGRQVGADALGEGGTEAYRHAGGESEGDVGEGVRRLEHHLRGGGRGRGGRIGDGDTDRERVAVEVAQVARPVKRDHLAAVAPLGVGEFRAPRVGGAVGAADPVGGGRREVREQRVGAVLRSRHGDGPDGRAGRGDDGADQVAARQLRRRHVGAGRAVAPEPAPVEVGDRRGRGGGGGGEEERGDGHGREDGDEDELAAGGGEADGMQQGAGARPRGQGDGQGDERHSGDQLEEVDGAEEAGDGDGGVHGAADDRDG